MSDNTTEAVGQQEIDHETLERALDTWGLDAQVDKTEEELAELIVALKGNNVAAVIEELADVRIMVEQLMLEFGEEQVQGVIDQKMERLEDRIDSAQADGEDLVTDGGGTAVSSRDLYEFPMHNDSAVCTECGAEIEVPDVDDPNGDMKPPHWRREQRFDPFNDVFHALCDECYADEVSRIIDGGEDSGE